MPVSLIINTLNEEANILECIRSARKWVDEVVICDMYSDDKTVELATSEGARIVMHDRTGFVEPARFLAISSASHEWVLVLDADEKLTDELGAELRRIAAENVYEAVSFGSLYNFFGGPVFHGGFFNTNWTRFFKKETYLRLYNPNELIVHQNFNALYQLNSSKRYTLPKKFHILHNAYPTIEKYIIKTVDFYARVEARQKFDNKIRFSTWTMLYDAQKTFFVTYFVRRGFLDGVRGLILCVYYALYRFNIWANVWYLEKNSRKRDE